MKSKVGLWIDHRQAVIVFISGHEIEKKVQGAWSQGLNLLKE